MRTTPRWTLQFIVMGLLSLISTTLAQSASCNAFDPSGLRCEVEKALANCNPLARQFIRAAFHDVITLTRVSPQQIRGGADGSIQYEMTRTENQLVRRALEYAQTMSTLYSITYTDALMLGAVVAVQTCGGPVIPFRFGRMDASAADAPDRTPPANSTASDVYAFLIDRMGLTVSAAVALFGGGHSVAIHGKRQIGLDATPARLDNRYFVDLLTGRPEDEIISVTGEGGNPVTVIRLVSDTNMLKDVALRQAVQRFAQNADEFQREFASAFERMINMGAVWATNPRLPRKGNAINIGTQTGASNVIVPGVMGVVTAAMVAYKLMH